MTMIHEPSSDKSPQSPAKPEPQAPPQPAPRERATPEGDGLDPTRFGDWEKNGRCIDFQGIAMQ